MSYDVVLDTNVLIHAISCEDESKAHSCIHVLFKILDTDRYSIALDYENKILEEYDKNLSRHKGVLANRLEQAIEKSVLHE
jgi:predicted nucleic acid-binding protein